MFKVNPYFSQLQPSYLFAEIARRVRQYEATHPDGAEIISLGIGDVTLPLTPSVTGAMYQATDEMGCADSVRGYCPDGGYTFLTEAIAAHDYQSRNISIHADEVFVSDGAKSDLGNIGDLLSADNRVAVCDPVYPVYIDSNVMGGRAGRWDGTHYANLIYLPCTPENGFAPQLPTEHADIIYLCSPNNPTGTALTYSQLKQWVDYARSEESLIIFDSAYMAYIRQDDIPHSIYEIEGAREVAIEVRSFSKTAGFTGLRCGYTVVPRALTCRAEGGPVSLHSLWSRRQSTKFNGAGYIAQRAALATYTPQGIQETLDSIDYYMSNAAMMRRRLCEAGFTCYGGENAPYLWLRTPDGQSSWSCFDRLLNECRVVVTPGSGFGPNGEGFIRLTAFQKREKIQTAMERIRQLM